MPGIFLGQVAEADQLFVNGVQQGQTGTFVHRARDYRAGISRRISRLYPIHLVDLTSPSNDQIHLSIRVQAIDRQPGLSDGPILIGEMAALVPIKEQRKILIFIEDIILLSVCLVGALFSLISVFGRTQFDRNKWLPFFLGGLFISTLPYSLFLSEYGLDPTQFVWVVEAVPYLLFGFLHASAILNIRLSRISFAAIALFYGILGSIYLFNPATEVFSYSVVLAFSMAVVPACELLWKTIVNMRRGVPTSIWISIALAATGITTALYLFWFGSIDLHWDPFYYLQIVVVLCLIFSMADDHRRDRQALARVTGQLMVAQDAERERLAKDLHDELSHRVTAVRLLLENLVRGKNPPARTDLDRPIEELRGMGLDVSALVEGLRPATLDGLTFADAVSQAVGRWQSLSETRIRLSIEGDGKLPGDTQTQVLRILQEALHNAVRHSQSRAISVSASLVGGKGRIDVSDDGIGFTKDEKQAGIGLKTMEERASLIGGKLTIESAARTGTQILLEFSAQ